MLEDGRYREARAVTTKRDQLLPRRRIGVGRLDGGVAVLIRADVFLDRLIARFSCGAAFTRWFSRADR